MQDAGPREEYSDPEQRQVSGTALAQLRAELARLVQEREAYAERYRREHRRAERAEQLARIAHDLNADLDLDRQFATLGRHILRLTDLPGCRIALIDEQDSSALIHTALTPGETTTTRFSMRERASAPTTMLDVICAEGRPILTDDYLAECQRRTLQPQWPETAGPARGWLGVPLRTGERIIGALAAWTGDGPIDAETLDTLSALAEQSASALEHARLYATIERQRREEAALSAIAQSLADSLDGESIIYQIGRYIPDLLGDTCQIALYDPRSDRLTLRRFERETVEPEIIELRPDEGLAGYIWRVGQPVIASDYQNDRRFTAPTTVQRPWISAIGVPIALGGEQLGVLLIGSWEWRHFTGRDEATLTRLATQIALAVRNARALAAERERAARAEALREIGRDLSASLDLERFFDSLRRHLKQLTGLNNCWVGQCDEAHGAQLSLWVDSGERRPDAEGPLPLPLPPSMFREIVEEGRSILTADYAQECRRRGLPTAGFQADLPNRYWLGMPLRARDRTIGALAVWRWDGPISDEVVGVLETLAGQIATALENAWLYQAAERQRREEAAFSTIAQDLAASLDGTTTLQRITDHARSLLGVGGSRLILQDSATGLLKTVAGDGEDAGEHAGASVDPDAGLIGMVWRTRRPIATSNYFEDDRFTHTPGLDHQARRDRVQAILAVPILLGDQLLGILCAYSAEPRAFSTEDEAILMRLAHLAAVAIHNARLYAEARRLAVGDPLTGLLNHRSLQERLDQELARAARHDHSLAIVMLDLDNFKLFNDTYGHPVGDQILQATAAILRAEARTADIIARYGGDEFCLILPETTRDGALSLVKRVQDRCRSIDLRAEPLRPPTNQSVGPILLRVSAGVALYPHDTTNRHELVSRADVALYADKRNGHA